MGDRIKISAAYMKGTRVKNPHSCQPLDTGTQQVRASRSVSSRKRTLTGGLALN